MLRRKKLFIQAPTGTGKTLSTVFPAVKAVGEGLAERIFYATAKTITRTVAEETFEILRGKYMMAAVYALIYTLANITRELLEPKLLGDKLGISPLMVVVSVYVGVCIYGFWGFALGPFSYIFIREIWREVLEDGDTF
jgi:hypothetical protein